VKFEKCFRYKNATLCSKNGPPNSWQRTRVGDRLSEPSKIISGVIQGSCIGPLLFLLYINSLAEIFDSNINCVLFADDVKLCTLIKCRYDFVNLQNSLDRILDWSNEHQLAISVKSAPALYWVIRSRVTYITVLMVNLLTL